MIRGSLLKPGMMMAKQDSLDPQARDLVRFAAAIAQGYEPELRERVGPLQSSQVPVAWVEELLLQESDGRVIPGRSSPSRWRKFSESGGASCRSDQD